MGIWGRVFQVEGTDNAKTEAVVCLACSRNSRKASVAGVE